MLAARTKTQKRRKLDWIEKIMPNALEKKRRKVNKSLDLDAKINRGEIPHRQNAKPLSRICRPALPAGRTLNVLK